MIEEIKHEQRALLQQLEVAIGINMDQGDCHMPTECVKLPADSLEDLCEFERYLAKQENFFRVSNHFHSLGGFGEKDVVRRMLQAVMTNNLSRMYSWKGPQDTKLSFYNFSNILKLLSTFLRHHYSSCIDADVENSVKRWLMHGADRDCDS